MSDTSLHSATQSRHRPMRAAVHRTLSTTLARSAPARDGTCASPPECARYSQLPRHTPHSEGSQPELCLSPQCGKQARSELFPSFLSPPPRSPRATAVTPLEVQNTSECDGEDEDEQQGEKSPTHTDTLRLECRVCREAVPNRYPSQARSQQGFCSARCRYTWRNAPLLI